MISDTYNFAHRIKYIRRRGKLNRDPQTTAMLSDRFQLMYRQMGLDRAQAAKLLHVSERTVRNWESGKHEIPYSAYKLLRLLSYSELPGKAWTGWHISCGKLWSPEGHSFRPADSNWWSNLCRRSDLFHVLYEENTRLRREVAAAAESVARSGGGFAGVEVLVTPQLSPISGNDTLKTQQPRGFAKSCPNVKFWFLRIKGTHLMPQSLQKYSFDTQKGGAK